MKSRRHPISIEGLQAILDEHRPNLVVSRVPDEPLLRRVQCRHHPYVQWTGCTSTRIRDLVPSSNSFRCPYCETINRSTAVRKAANQAESDRRKRVAHDALIAHLAATMPTLQVEAYNGAQNITLRCTSCGKVQHGMSNVNIRRSVASKRASVEAGKRCCIFTRGTASAEAQETTALLRNFGAAR